MFLLLLYPFQNKRRQALSEPQLANRFSVRLLLSPACYLVILLGVVESHISSTQGPVNRLHFLCLGINSQAAPPVNWDPRLSSLLGLLTPSMGGEYEELPFPLWGPSSQTNYSLCVHSCFNAWLVAVGSLGLGGCYREVPAERFLALRPPSSQFLCVRWPVAQCSGWQIQKSLC